MFLLLNKPHFFDSRFFVSRSDLSDEAFLLLNIPVFGVSSFFSQPGNGTPLSARGLQNRFYGLGSKLMIAELNAHLFAVHLHDQSSNARRIDGGKFVQALYQAILADRSNLVDGGAVKEK